MGKPVSYDARKVLAQFKPLYEFIVDVASIDDLAYQIEVVKFTLADTKKDLDTTQDALRAARAELAAVTEVVTEQVKLVERAAVDAEAQAKVIREEASRQASAIVAEATAKAKSIMDDAETRSMGFRKANADLDADVRAKTAALAKLEKQITDLKRKFD